MLEWRLSLSTRPATLVSWVLLFQEAVVTAPLMLLKIVHKYSGRPFVVK